MGWSNWMDQRDCLNEWTNKMVSLDGLTEWTEDGLTG